MGANSYLQSEKRKAVMKIRAKLLDAARLWFSQNDYVEVQGPIIVPAVGKRPCSFDVKYFDKRAYLSHGLQPYSGVFVNMFEKVYTVAPVFRAEKLMTKRHLAEYWRIEVAASLQELDGIINVQERLVEHICNSISREAAEELKVLDRGCDDLARVRVPLPRLTYDDAIERLQKEGCDVWWGEELSWDLEKKLSLGFKQPFFVVEYPVNAETFFYETNPQKSEVALVADLLAPEGYGEIASSGQIINEKKLLRKKMMEEKIEPAAQRWYMDLGRFSKDPCSGFAIGVERLLQWICKLEHIEEAVAFPRTYEKFYP